MTPPKPLDLDFDHCYTTDRGHHFLARLKEAGFTLDAQTVEHPGRHVCRFISFAPPGRSTRQYLEFISKPAERSDKPGLSLSTGGLLANLFRRIESDRFLRPTFEHRNYDWKETGDRTRRLGWNFVKFRRKTPSAEIWLTEYERPDGKKPRWAVRPRHENGALGIIGLVFEADALCRRYLERVVRTRITGRLRLPSGVELVLEPSLRTKFSGVLLKVSDFRKFCARARPDDVSLRAGRRTAVFRNPAGMWDVLVV